MYDFTLPPRPRLPLTTTQAWREYVAIPDAPLPPRLSKREFDALSSADRVRYASLRLAHHANLGPFATQQLEDFKAEAQRIFDSNRQDGTRLRPSFTLDALPGTGKSTAVKLFARDVWRSQIDERTDKTYDGGERIPVTRMSVKGAADEREIDEGLAKSYTGSRARRRQSAPPLDRFIEYCLAGETALVICDDFHHIDRDDDDKMIRISNHLKGIAEEVAATFLFVGVYLNQLPFLNEANASKSASLSQTTRRWTPLTMDSMRLRTDAEREDWMKLLRTIDRNIVLVHHVPGTVPGMARTLYERTQGHMQTLFDLINQATRDAIRDGTEHLSVEALDKTPMSIAATAGYKEVKAAEKAKLKRLLRRSDEDLGSLG